MKHKFVNTHNKGACLRLIDIIYQKRLYDNDILQFPLTVSLIMESDKGLQTKKKLTPLLPDEVKNVVVFLRLLGVELEEGLPRKRVVCGSDLVTNTEHVPNMHVIAFPDQSDRKFDIHKSTVKENRHGTTFVAL
jgi:hypothetical protein